MGAEGVVEPTSSEPDARGRVSDVGETTAAAMVATEAGDAPVGGAQFRGDELEEWFARAAAGRASDEDGTRRRELVGAATLPVQDDFVRPPRPRRALMRASGVTRLRRACARALVPGMGAVAALLVVVVVVMWSTTSPSTPAKRSTVVTDETRSIDKLGEAVDRSRSFAIARQKGARARRRAVAQAGRHRANERRERAQRRLLATRRRAAARASTTTPPLARHAAASPPARSAPSPTRRRQPVPRRPTCGPFDLC
jgi:hypothetical protein